MIDDLQKRVFLLKNWFKFDNFVQVQRVYRFQYAAKTFSSISIVKNIISMFEKTCSVLKKVHKSEKKQKSGGENNSSENPHYRVFFTINPKDGVSSPGID